MKLDAYSPFVIGCWSSIYLKPITSVGWLVEKRWANNRKDDMKNLNLVAYSKYWEQYIRCTKYITDRWWKFEFVNYPGVSHWAGTLYGEFNWEEEKDMKYIKPESNIVEIEPVDVLVASGWNNNGNGNGNGHWFDQKPGNGGHKK